MTVIKNFNKCAFVHAFVHLFVHFPRRQALTWKKGSNPATAPGLDLRRGENMPADTPPSTPGGAQQLVSTHLSSPSSAWITAAKLRLVWFRYR